MRNRTIIIMVIAAISAFLPNLECYGFDGNTRWFNAGSNDKWCTAANWGVALPVSTDECGVVLTDCRVDTTCTGQICNGLFIGNIGTPPTVRMINGTLTIVGTKNFGSYVGHGICSQQNRSGIFDMSDGIVNNGGNLTIGKETGSNGQMIMRNGTYNCTGSIGLGGSGVTAHIQLDGGTINGGSLTISAGGTIDITGGELVLNGDVRGTVNGYVTAHKITAYGGSGFVSVDYGISHSGKTTAKAVQEITTAGSPKPVDGAIYVTIGTTLTWSPSGGAVSHDVYFGTSSGDVNSANNIMPVGGIYKGNVDTNSYYPCSWEPNTTYYWRIDEVNDLDSNSPYKGTVWSFKTSRPSDWQGFYGVEFAQPSDFPALKARGVNTVLVIPVSSNPSSSLLKSFYDPAVANDMKLILDVYDPADGKIWNWNSTNNEWELSISRYPGSGGAQLLKFLRDNPTYLAHTAAIYGFHEPFNSESPGTMVSADQQKKFWRQIHEEEFPAGNLKIYSESTTWNENCKNGCADYDMLGLYSFYYCNGGNNYRPIAITETGPYGFDLYAGSCTADKNAAMKIESDGIDLFYDKIQKAPPAPDGSRTKYIVLVQTFSIDGSTVFPSRMPSAQELLEWGRDIVQVKKDKVAGLLYYSWGQIAGGYTQYLAHNRYDSGSHDRWQSINDVANIMLRPKFDFTGDGMVNEHDLAFFVNKWLYSGKQLQDSNCDCIVNFTDFASLANDWLDAAHW